ncbi:MAG: hypothetical protein ACQKBW_12975 [Puniceicoccales bacterium]
MYNKFYHYLTAILLLIATTSCWAQTATTTIKWGGDNPIGSSFLLSDSTGELFDNNAIVAMGYFNAGFDIDANVTDVQAIYDNLVVLDTAIVGEGEQSYYDGFVTADTTIDTTTPDGSAAVGQVVYYWVLAGVTTYSEEILSSIAEMALVTDSSWDVGETPGAIPNGTVSGNTYNIATNYLDTIVYGTNGGAGVGAGSITIRTEQVPEPAFYAAGLGMVALMVVWLRRRRAA